jgi:hypothetical protein
MRIKPAGTKARKSHMTYCPGTEYLARTPSLRWRERYLRGQCGRKRCGWTSDRRDLRDSRGTSNRISRCSGGARQVEGVGNDDPFGGGHRVGGESVESEDTTKAIQRARAFLQQELKQAPSPRTSASRNCHYGHDWITEGKR